MSNTPTPEEMALRQRIARAVRAVREIRGLSRAKLATRAGLTARTVYFIESGGRGMQLRTLARVAEALDVPMALLLMDAAEVWALDCTATAHREQVLAAEMAARPCHADSVDRLADIIARRLSFEPEPDPDLAHRAKAGCVLAGTTGGVWAAVARQRAKGAA